MTPLVQTLLKVKVKSLSHVQLFATPWTVAYQAPPSMGFSRQECWSGLPFPSPGDLLNPGIEPGSPTLQADALLYEPLGKKTLLEVTNNQPQSPYTQGLVHLRPNNNQGRDKWIKALLSKALPNRVRPSFSHHQCLPSGNFLKLSLLYQRADRRRTNNFNPTETKVKPHIQKLNSIKKQKLMSQMKGQDKTSEKSLNVVEIGNLPGKRIQNNDSEHNSGSWKKNRGKC